MLARIRKAQEEREGGFTLIELLVVMIIIGILAAIAIPVFLSQRAKAQDTATKADVATVGKEIATYYVDNADDPTLALTATGRYVLKGAGIAAAAGQDLGKVSNNVTLGTVTLGTSTGWCVSLKNPKGDKAVVGYKYSASAGLAEGVC
jgi:type IV pilus assembly protein PilA